MNEAHHKLKLRKERRADRKHQDGETSKRIRKETNGFLKQRKYK